MPLRIAYVASRWDYGDPRRGLSFEETNFRGALEGMGHEVFPYDFMTRHQEVGKRKMNEELVRFVKSVEPDMAFFILFEDEIGIDAIRTLTSLGIKTFNWFCDDHWRFASFSRYYAPAFSLVATTHRESVAKYHSIGCSNVTLSQWACNRYSYGKRAKQLQYEVTFVGQPYGDRRKVVKQLRKAGFDVRCWGYGWESGRLDQQQMIELFGASRVNLNLSNSWTGPRWHKRPVVGQIKARIFEIAGSGGFVLTEHSPHLEDYFELEREMSAFVDSRELIAKVGFWLERDDERASIADSGYRRVLAEHTYDHRFTEIFRALGLSG